MPCYFFVTRCPQFIVPDSKGVELSSEADARKYVSRLIEELLQDTSTRGGVLKSRSKTIRVESCSSFLSRAPTCINDDYFVSHFYEIHGQNSGRKR